MGGKSMNLRPTQERSLRSKWTPDLDKIFADLVLEQIQLGKRPNEVFDKKTWNHIRDVFNKQTARNFTSSQLRKHLDILRTRFLDMKSAPYSNDIEVLIDDTGNIDYKMLDNDYEVQLQAEQNKVNESPIFEQLSQIFAESEGDGKYAHSSHYKEVEKSLPCTDASLVKSSTPCAAMTVQNASESIPDRKRKHTSVDVSVPQQAMGVENVSEIMGKALVDMLNTSTLRRNLKPKQKEKFTITKCIEVLDETEAEERIDKSLYFAAIDLFEDPDMREVFISLKSNKIRLAWLRGKCGKKEP